jgi:RNA polymerase sigma-54 factor
MALQARLEMRQGQALVMTPQLQQAIKLLQLSSLELAAYVDEELERNPLLERAEPAPEPESPSEPAGGADEAPFAAQESLDTDLENLHPDLSADERLDAGAAPLMDWSKASSSHAHDDLPGFEDSLTEDTSLAQHLDAQLGRAALCDRDRMIGAALIDQIDEWGYFRGDTIEIARQLGAQAGDVDRVLGVMQGFEPVGVMARSIEECLALQLKDRNRLDPAMQALLANLALLAKRDFAKLQTICGVDGEDLAEMVAEIKALTPKPGAAFGGGAAQTVVPDVYVRAAPDGSWMVELNADALPKLLMNTRYYAQVSAGAKREGDKQFLTDCAANANWLIKSLDQRARTILKVAKEIVRQQDGFLALGVEHLRPLNLKMIADAIEMHESTVSRVTTNKYISTPRGVFELKYFFTAAIAATEGGEAHSAEAVRRRIQKLIELERPDDILSDDRIVELLRASGVDIARRTVAKYRESLHIPSSVERKKISSFAR